MPLAAARALSGVAASTSGGWNTGSESFLVAGRRAARRRPHCPPAASFAAAVAVSVSDARPLPPRRRRSSLLIVSASASSSSQPPPPQLFGPPPFDPAKLTVTRLSGAEKESNSRRGRGGGNGSSAPATAAAAAGTSAAAATSKSPSPLFPLPRRYTLTHNDVTGALALSIGSEYNSAQLEGWYVRMIRDEVLAEWRREDEDKGNGGEAVGVERADGGDGSSSGSSSSSSSPSSSSASDHSLHIFCHVSGDARWLAPPRLRSRIFQREMALVLDTIAHADAELMRSHPGLGSARVVVHLRSHVRSLDARLVWGMLGDRGGWREPPRLLEGLLEGGAFSFFPLRGGWGGVGARRGRRREQSTHLGLKKKYSKTKTKRSRLRPLARAGRGHRAARRFCGLLRRRRQRL